MEKATTGQAIALPPQLEVSVTPTEPFSQKTGKTKQKYLNPKTGKMVGYVRAKVLGLI